MSTSTRPLRIAIECRISDFRQGIGTATQALARALSQAGNGRHEYTFLVNEEGQSRLAPHIWGACRIVSPPGRRLSFAKKVARRMPFLRSLRDRVRGFPLEIPESDGYVEANGFDIVHFPMQDAYRTSLPSIYQPHDLQHLHYPQYFPDGRFEQRDARYRAFCEQARFVCVQTEWTKADLVKNYHLPPEKIAVIPWGCTIATNDAEAPVSDARPKMEALKLPDRYFFYPAVTWEHKNHLCLIKALAALKIEHKLTPSLVLTGVITDYYKKVLAHANEAGVARQIVHLGFVSVDELRQIYRSAVAMVYPSRFEGFGLPILEAFGAGTPVLCSDSSVLPEVAQDGALYFSPDDPGRLASLMQSVIESPSQRESLIAAGKSVLSQYSFERTAGKFQALYDECWRAAQGASSQVF